MCKSIESYMSSCFTRFHFTFTTMILSQKEMSSYEKKYEAKLPNLYQMRGETDVQYSRRIQNLIIKKKRIFSSSVIRYSFVLRYISLQTYRLLMKEFPFSSLTLLEKISERQFNARNYTKSLKSQGVI